MFEYNYFNELVKKIVPQVRAPIQVELHPGSGCAGYRCKFCYGQRQERTSGELLNLEDYQKLLDDLKGKVRFLTMAGINTDPLVNSLTYGIIKKIKENDLRVGIHTKGHVLTARMADLLVTNTDYGDFLTFSIDSSDSEVYKSLHVLPEKGDYFEIIKKNIAYVYKKKTEAKSNLNINVSYLMFKENTDREQLEKFIEIFSPISDRIRFTLPQVPNEESENPDYYLDQEGQKKAGETIHLLKEKYSKKNIHITFLNFGDHEHRTDFKYCYAQRFQAVIDHCGYVFPCPQVATKGFEHLAYGNIKDKGFWDIWDSEKKQKIYSMKVQDMGCRICDRKDEALNIEFSKLFKNGKVM